MITHLFALFLCFELYISDSSDIKEYLPDVGNVQPYNFQPVSQSPVLVEMDDVDTSAKSDCSDGEDNRVAGSDWCKCNNKCKHQLLVRDKEHFCCIEIGKIKCKAMQMNYLI